MTEDEWLTCTDPEKMLGFLEGRASERKLRLFACACCRRIWRLLVDERSRQAVELSERFADGQATSEELAAAAYAATGAVHDRQGGSNAPAYAAADPTTIGAFIAADYADAAASAAVRDAMRTEPWRSTTIRNVEERHQTLLLRDLFGPLPFRPIALNPSSLTFAVKGVAQALYADRPFDQLPVLADALEDAGCDNSDILRHCRGRGPHVRGCWALDLILGKE